MTDAGGRLYERLLVVRCQIGEPAALAELIARYSPRLRFYISRMVGDRVADDLLQETWIAVWAKVARLNDPGAFAAWVYRIARDKAYRELRRRRLPCTAVDETPVGEIVDEPAYPDEADVEALRAALEKPRAEHREVLVLQFVEGMTYEQIAAVLGCPAGTVRSRIHYAKAALCAALGDDSASRKDPHE